MFTFYFHVEASRCTPQTAVCPRRGYMLKNVRHNYTIIKTHLINWNTFRYFIVILRFSWSLICVLHPNTLFTIKHCTLMTPLIIQVYNYAFLLIACTEATTKTPDVSIAHCRISLNRQVLFAWELEKPFSFPQVTKLNQMLNTQQCPLYYRLIGQTAIF